MRIRGSAPTIPPHTLAKPHKTHKGYQSGGKKAMWFLEAQRKWQSDQLITMSCFFSVYHLSLQCVLRTSQGCSISELPLWESIAPGHMCCSGSRFQGCSAFSPPPIFPSLSSSPCIPCPLIYYPIRTSK